MYILYIFVKYKILYRENNDVHFVILIIKNTLNHFRI